MRLAAAAMVASEPDGDSGRGVIITTASIAAYEGQIGQVPYAAAKGGVVSMTLVAARDLAVSGVRVLTIAPGTFFTPAFMMPEEEASERYAQAVPFPKRMGRPAEYAQARAVDDRQRLPQRRGRPARRSAEVRAEVVARFALRRNAAVYCTRRIDQWYIPVAWSHGSGGRARRVFVPPPLPATPKAAGTRRHLLTVAAESVRGAWLPRGVDPGHRGGGWPDQGRAVRALQLEGSAPRRGDPLEDRRARRRDRLRRGDGRTRHMASS